VSILEKYISELDSDVALDELNLKENALMLPARKAKWVSRLMKEKAALNELNKEKNQLIGKIGEEIRKESPVRLTTIVCEKTAEKHEAVVEINKQINEKKIIIEFLEKVEKTIHSIGFDIKNLVDIIKMETT
jgi:hypothetical protein